MKNLSPCPFCGSDESFRYETNNVQVQYHTIGCDSCKAQVSARREAEAEIKWNRRAVVERVETGEIL